MRRSAVVAVAIVMGALALRCLPSIGQAQTSPRNSEEQQALDIADGWVAAVVAGDVEKVASYMANDVSFSGRYPELAPQTGLEAYLRGVRPVIQSGVQMHVLQRWVAAGRTGAVVVLRQRNTFTVNDRRVTAEVAGIFIIKDGKIRAWYNVPLEPPSPAAVPGPQPSQGSPR